MYLRLGNAFRALQKVEITAAVGLQDFVPVEPRVATLGNGRRYYRPARQLLGRHKQVEATLGDR